ncbi:hypothetical protein SKAU_G00104250 [Synaphobranchus kaupii]|uniref:Uncharacterized protein n=1 Tax=Synaphobranchus kaupii TaxID=118154 RepID=A0A9Q1J6N8_SYNKA|nr:hypothetical protein SKAU_G00104250 [Synaphobranchus kaupii]
MFPGIYSLCHWIECLRHRRETRWQKADRGDDAGRKPTAFALRPKTTHWNMPQQVSRTRRATSRRITVP